MRINRIISILITMCFIFSTSIYAEQFDRKNQFDLQINISDNNSLIFDIGYPSTNSYFLFQSRDFIEPLPFWETVFDTNDGPINLFSVDNIEIGKIKEYKLYTNEKATYAIAGINVSPNHFFGTLILIINDSQYDLLESEIEELKLDLVGDGYDVDVFRVTNENHFQVKDYIVQKYNELDDLVGIYLLGNLPVAYSGNIVPDAHNNNHWGAWPSDGYYLELTSEWTDDTNYSNTYPPSQTNPRMINAPSDGKFDQSTFPSSLEIMGGRVDLSEMTLFDKNETELLRQYLGRAHDFKNKIFTPSNQYLLRTGFNLGGAQSAYYASLFKGRKWLNETSDWNVARNNSFIFGYGSGGGSYLSANNVGHTRDYAENAYYVVFNNIFGSYFGDWDVENNFLRAPLAAEGYGLANFWSGRPLFYPHFMALGKPVGLSAKISAQVYAFGFAGYVQGRSNCCSSQVHSALQGDPTLRVEYLSPVDNLSVSYSNGVSSISWDETSDVLGYYVYGSKNRFGNFSLLNENYITSNNFDDRSNFKYYMVRPVNLTLTGAGSYFNLGIGKIVEISGDNNPPQININYPINDGIHSSTFLDLDINFSEYVLGNYTLNSEKTFFESNDTKLNKKIGPLINGLYNLVFDYVDSSDNMNSETINFEVLINQSDLLNSSFENNVSIGKLLKRNFELNFSTRIKNLRIYLNNSRTFMRANLSDKNVNGIFYLNNVGKYNVSIQYMDIFDVFHKKDYIIDFQRGLRLRNLDNDSIADRPGQGVYLDRVQGNKSFITTNLDFNFSINESEDMSLNYNGTYPVKYKLRGKNFLNYNFNFSKNPLFLMDIKILVDDTNSSYLFSGVDHIGGKNVTLELPSLGYTSLCLVDRKINSFFETNFTLCNGINETYISDIDSFNHSEYKLELNGTFLSISGLKNSAIGLICEENWICSDWSSCVSGIQTRVCSDNSLCGTNDNKPIESQSCSEDNGGGGGSGGSSGRGNINIITNGLNNNSLVTVIDLDSDNVCNPDLVFSVWGECKNKLQLRTFTDRNSCMENGQEERICSENFDKEAIEVEIEKSSSGSIVTNLGNSGTSFISIKNKFEEERFLFFDEESGEEYLATFYETKGDDHYYYIQKIAGESLTFADLPVAEKIDYYNSIVVGILVLFIIVLFSLVIYLKNSKAPIYIEFGYDKDTFDSLINYVKENKGKFSDEELKRTLIGASWNEGAVNYVIKRLK